MSPTLPKWTVMCVLCAILCASAHSTPNTCNVFVNPVRVVKSSVGTDVQVRVDACVTLGEECQAPAAVRFCTEVGYSNATLFDGSGECMLTAAATLDLCHVDTIARHACGCLNFIQCC